MSKTREFFQIAPHRVKAILQLLAVEEVTPREDVVEDASELQEMVDVQAKKKSGRFRFSSAAVPNGAVLEFVRDLSITATVESDTTVIYQGVSMSLSAAALEAIHRCGYKWNTLAGPDYWTYQGKSLNELRFTLQETSSN